MGQNIYADLLKQLIDDGTLEPTGVDYDPYGGYAMNAPIVALLQDGAGVDTVSGSEVVEVVTFYRSMLRPVVKSAIPALSRLSSGTHGRDGYDATRRRAHRT